MPVTTYEATVEDGQIKLPQDVRLSDRTRVYVVVPAENVEYDVYLPPREAGTVVHIRSPRLVGPWRASDFEMEVTEER